MPEVQNTSAPDGTSSLLSDYIDKPSLARELGRTVRTLDRLILCDGLPVCQIGKRRLFRRSAVLEWLRERETPVRPPSNGRQRRGAR